MSKYFCTLCGKKSENIRDLTKDHVPAKCLYRDPTGLQLNSVPTCFECNNGYKHRDEEFAMLIGIKASNGNSISGNAFFQERVRPMFRNNMAKGRSILKRVKNRLGFYMFQLTADELNNFLRDSPVKIIKSFYRKFTGRYLETDCIKKIRFLDASIDSIEIETIKKNLEVKKKIGTFEYFADCTKHNFKSNKWLFSFFDQIFIYSETNLE